MIHQADGGREEEWAGHHQGHGVVGNVVTRSAQMLLCCCLAEFDTEADAQAAAAKCVVTFTRLRLMSDEQQIKCDNNPYGFFKLLPLHPELDRLEVVGGGEVHGRSKPSSTVFSRVECGAEALGLLLAEDAGDLQRRDSMKPQGKSLHPFA
ncbi:hypothetical protein EYF80_019967 [Liparis tanakae]|uniref:Uncharacterized protein n=1 Tax=Liparis tanakae TaxID=230148 RepID=A0A4Z2HVN4_9TELE|nr:hypothetical protein EYF80_019967 [Liparis tanakae]